MSLPQAQFSTYNWVLTLTDDRPAPRLPHLPRVRLVLPRPQAQAGFVTRAPGLGTTSVCAASAATSGTAHRAHVRARLTALRFNHRRRQVQWDYRWHPRTTAIWACAATLVIMGIARRRHVVWHSSSGTGGVLWIGSLHLNIPMQERLIPGSSWWLLSCT